MRMICQGSQEKYMRIGFMKLLSQILVHLFLGSLKWNIGMDRNGYNRIVIGYAPT